MNKKYLKDLVKSLCPNIPAVRKFLTKKKISMMQQLLMTAEEVELGEQHPEKKQELVDRYMHKDPKRNAKDQLLLEEMLKKAPSLQNRQDLDKVITDIWFCRFAYGFAMDEYVFYGIEEKNIEERKAYVPDWHRRMFSHRCNDFAQILVFNDKFRTYELLKPYYKRDAVSIKGKEDYAVFESFVKKHPVFMKKQVGNTMGRGIELIEMDKCGKPAQEVFNSFLSEGKVILEERIKQSADLAAFNESSANTIRFVTLNTRHGVEALPHPFLRAGRKGQVVDNAGAGGVFAAIDIKTGIIHTDGINELGQFYECHPDSGVRYKGFQLPEWDQVVSICKEMAAKVPYIRYCAWDMAHTDDGWVVVEGNGAGQLVCQAPLGRGIKDDLDAIMEDMDLMA